MTSSKSTLVDPLIDLERERRADLHRQLNDLGARLYHAEPSEALTPREHDRDRLLALLAWAVRDLLVGGDSHAR